MTREEFIKKLDSADFDRIYVRDFRGTMVEPRLRVEDAILPSMDGGFKGKVLIIE